MARRVLWIRVCSSFCLSVLLSGSFRGIDLLIFSETQLGVRVSCGFVLDWAGFFFKKNFCPKNWENEPKNEQKIKFLWIYYKICPLRFFRIWSIKKVYKELLYSCTNPILEKNLIPDIWAKMLLTNQSVAFLNQQNL